MAENAWTLEQVGLLVGIVSGAIGALTALAVGGLWIIRAWRARPWLRLTLRQSYLETVRPDEDGYTTRHFITLDIRNTGGSALRVESWGVEGIRVKGPFAMMQDGLPATLEPHGGEVSVDIYPLETFLREPRELHVIDQMERKWRVPPKELQRFIKLAKELTALNEARVPVPRPGRIRPPSGL